MGGTEHHGDVVQGPKVTKGCLQFFVGAVGAERVPRNEHYRQKMLARVNSGWIKGVLEQSLHGAAMIELGLSLFVFAACVAFWQWAGAKARDHQWLYLAAFLMGVAAGSKYLPLVYLPLFALGLLMIERRPLQLLGTVVCFLLPCIYWYARNFMLTGDPFNPFGAAVFGYTDWSANDIAGQFNYTSNHSGWPPWLLWPALVSLFSPATWKHPGWRMAAIFSIWALISWYVSSGGYVRFLIPAYPVLVLLAARGWVGIYRLIREKTRARSFAPGRRQMREEAGEEVLSGKAQTVGLALLILVSGGFALEKMSRDWIDIQSDDAGHAVYLRNTITGYEVISQLADVPHSGIYQFGLEDSVYYFPQPVWGDHFGSMRYADMAALPAAKLAEKLHSMDIDILVINRSLWPGIDTADGFDAYFEVMIRGESVSVYRSR